MPDEGNIEQRSKQILSDCQATIEAVETSLSYVPCGIFLPNLGTIIEVLHLNSLIFEGVPRSHLKHHPYYFHKNKLVRIRMRLTKTFSEILYIYRDGLNLNKEYWADIILEKGEYILRVLMPMIAEEYHNIKHLIVIFERDEFYSKLIATQLVQAFPTGSSKRASVIRALREKVRITSECLMRMQLGWSSAPLESNDK